MKRITLCLIFLLPVALIWAAPAAAQEGEFSFVGSKNCKKCHIKEFKSWEETRMSKAFESLKPGVGAEAKQAVGLDPNEDFTSNAECLSCHVTGYGKPGGFTSIEETPDLAGVGCETCHGPGGTYTQDEYMSLKNKEYKKAEVVAVGMVDTVSEAQCIDCHKAAEPFPGAEYTFNFEEQKDKGTHEQFPLKYKHD